MSNQNVANIALAHYQQGAAEAAANAIVRRATQLWREKEEVVDDITCVVIFFEQKLIMKNLYSRADLKKMEDAAKTRQDLSSVDDSTTPGEESKQDEAAQVIEHHRQMKRPSKPAASPGLMETESFTNFVSTKTAQGKAA